MSYLIIAVFMLVAIVYAVYRSSIGLWERQDRVIFSILTGALDADWDIPADIRALRRNIYCKLAYHFAPSNLVIRNLCVLALVDKKGNNRKIIPLIEKLIDEKNWLWKEGYSYWLDVRPILVKWGESFSSIIIPRWTPQIESAFCRTAYRGADGQLYPCPIGDCTKAPLDAETLNYLPNISVSKMQSYWHQSGVVCNPAVLYNGHTGRVNGKECTKFEYYINAEGKLHVRRDIGKSWVGYDLYQFFDDNPNRPKPTFFQQAAFVITRSWTLSKGRW